MFIFHIATIEVEAAGHSQWGASGKSFENLNLGSCCFFLCFLHLYVLFLAFLDLPIRSRCLLRQGHQFLIPVPKIASLPLDPSTCRRCSCFESMSFHYFRLGSVEGECQGTAMGIAKLRSLLLSLTAKYATRPGRLLAYATCMLVLNISCNGQSARTKLLRC